MSPMNRRKTAVSNLRKGSEVGERAEMPHGGTWRDCGLVGCWGVCCDMPTGVGNGTAPARSGIHDPEQGQRGCSWQVLTMYPKRPRTPPCTAGTPGTLWRSELEQVAGEDTPPWCQECVEVHCPRSLMGEAAEAGEGLV